MHTEELSRWMHNWGKYTGLDQLIFQLLQTMACISASRPLMNIKIQLEASIFVSTNNTRKNIEFALKKFSKYYFWMYNFFLQSMVGKCDFHNRVDNQSTCTKQTWKTTTTTVTHSTSFRSLPGRTTWIISCMHRTTLLNLPICCFSVLPLC